MVHNPEYVRRPRRWQWWEKRGKTRKDSEEEAESAGDRRGGRRPWWGLGLGPRTARGVRPVRKLSVRMAFKQKQRWRSVQMRLNQLLIQVQHRYLHMHLHRPQHGPQQRRDPAHHGHLQARRR